METAKVKRKVNIPVQAIMRDLNGTGEVKTHSKLLDDLLADIVPVDFYSLNGYKPPKQRDYVVLSVGEFLKTSASKGWNLAVKNKQAYLYNGQFWKPLEDDLLKYFLTQSANKMGVNPNEANHHKTQDEFIKQFYASAYAPPTQKTAGDTLINLSNGTVCINESGVNVRQFNADDDLRYQLPYAYTPKATCPTFTAHLDRVLPDTAKQMVFQEFLGSIFIPKSKMKFEKVLVFYGSGSNGKSVCVDVVRAMLGDDNVSGFGLNSLLSDKSYSLPLIQDKLLNWSPELAQNLSNPDKFKSMVTGEPQEARRIFREPYLMTDYARLAFNCNILPKNAEQTDGFFRRFLIIDFDVKIPEHEQDLTLASRIIDTELPGVFNWMVEGLQRLLSNGKITDCEAVARATMEYKKESDNVLSWLEDTDYEPGSEPRLLADLYKEYAEYCKGNGYSAVSNKNLKVRLSNAGFTTRKLAAGMSVMIKNTAAIPF